MQLMLKKHFPILMMFMAVAIMLGHNIVGHHHHEIEHSIISHHSHSDNEHHGHDNESEDECKDWKHLFSELHHGADGIICLTSSYTSNNTLKLIPKFNNLNVSNFTIQQIAIDVRQNVPPFISDYSNSQNHLPSGLRAPPFFIV